MSTSPSRSANSRQRLGRGLAALLGDSKPEVEDTSISPGIKHVPIEFVRSNSRNPRQAFSESELEDLAASIRERGIIQPIIVRPVAGASDAYEIVAGERRWRAAQRAGHHSVPIICMQLTDREALEFSIVENVQRADLNALEEARGYARLAAEYGYSHSDIGRVIGKSRSHVANTLRLLALPEHTQQLLTSGAISAGHARALLGVPNPDSVADSVVSRGLSVREVERLSDSAKSSTPQLKHSSENDPVTKDLKNRISLALGLNVEILYNKRIRELRIPFKNVEQLEYICSKLVVE
jgi:ParB family chromosome partitioning protein